MYHIYKTELIADNTAVAQSGKAQNTERSSENFAVSLSGSYFILRVDGIVPHQNRKSEIGNRKRNLPPRYSANASICPLLGFGTHVERRPNT